LTERSVCARGVVKGVTEFPEKHDKWSTFKRTYRQMVRHTAFPTAVQQLQTQFYVTNSKHSLMLTQHKGTKWQFM